MKKVDCSVDYNLPVKVLPSPTKRKCKILIKLSKCEQTNPYLTLRQSFCALNNVKFGQHCDSCFHFFCCIAQLLFLHVNAQSDNAFAVEYWMLKVECSVCLWCVTVSTVSLLFVFWVFPLQLSPSVLWYCWLGLLTCKNRLPYNLYCVGGDVKNCTIQSVSTVTLGISSSRCEISGAYRVG